MGAWTASPPSTTPPGAARSPSIWTAPLLPARRHPTHAGGRGRAHRQHLLRRRPYGRLGAHYAASKAGLLALTAKAARELARDGIAVNAVLPSVIETDMLDDVARGAAAQERLRATIPVGRFGRPQEVAAVVRFLCTEAPDYLTGESISMRGGRL